MNLTPLLRRAASRRGACPLDPDMMSLLTKKVLTDYC